MNTTADLLATGDARNIETALRRGGDREGHDPEQWPWYRNQTRDGSISYNPTTAKVFGTVSNS